MIVIKYVRFLSGTESSMIVNDVILYYESNTLCFAILNNITHLKFEFVLKIKFFLKSILKLVSA